MRGHDFFVNPPLPAPRTFLSERSNVGPARWGGGGITPTASAAARSAPLRLISGPIHFSFKKVTQCALSPRGGRSAPVDFPPPYRLAGWIGARRGEGGGTDKRACKHTAADCPRLSAGAKCRDVNSWRRCDQIVKSCSVREIHFPLSWTRRLGLSVGMRVTRTHLHLKSQVLYLHVFLMQQHVSARGLHQVSGNWRRLTKAVAARSFLKSRCA